MQTLTIQELVHAAIATMPRWQRAFVKATLLRPRKRAEVYAGLGYQLSHDTAFLEYCENPTVFTGDSFGADTPIEFDPANLEAILQIILEYLPQILQLFLMFATIFLAVGLSVAYTGQASAQTVCVGGKCYQISTPVRSVVRVAMAKPDLCPVATVAVSPSCECDPCTCCPYLCGATTAPVPIEAQPTMVKTRRVIYSRPDRRAVANGPVRRFFRRVLGI